MDYPTKASSFHHVELIISFLDVTGRLVVSISSHGRYCKASEFPETRLLALSFGHDLLRSAKHSLFVVSSSYHSICNCQRNVLGIDYHHFM